MALVAAGVTTTNAAAEFPTPGAAGGALARPALSNRGSTGAVVGVGVATSCTKSGAGIETIRPPSSPSTPVDVFGGASPDPFASTVGKPTPVGVASGGDIRGGDTLTGVSSSVENKGKPGVAARS